MPEGNIKIWIPLFTHSIKPSLLQTTPPCYSLQIGLYQTYKPNTHYMNISLYIHNLLHLDNSNSNPTLNMIAVSPMKPLSLDGTAY